MLFLLKYTSESIFNNIITNIRMIFFSFNILKKNVRGLFETYVSLCIFKI